MKPAGGGGADDLFAEMKAKPIKLRATGGRTASGKFQPQAAGSGGAMAMYRLACRACAL